MENLIASQRSKLLNGFTIALFESLNHGCIDNIVANKRKNHTDGESAIITTHLNDFLSDSVNIIVFEERNPLNHVRNRVSLDKVHRDGVVTIIAHKGSINIDIMSVLYF